MEGKGKRNASLISVFVQLELTKETRSDYPPCHCSESSHCGCQFSVVLTLLLQRVVHVLRVGNTGSCVLWSESLLHNRNSGCRSLGPSSGVGRL
jgi:hypothetical protein